MSINLSNLDHLIQRDFTLGCILGSFPWIFFTIITSPSVDFVSIFLYVSSSILLVIGLYSLAFPKKIQHSQTRDRSLAIYSVLILLSSFATVVLAFIAGFAFVLGGIGRGSWFPDYLIFTICSGSGVAMFIRYANAREIKRGLIRDNPPVPSPVETQLY